MTFVFDSDRRVIVDPDTAEILQQRRFHYQDNRWFQTILSPDGAKRFTATILTEADGALPAPHKAGDHVLVSAVRHDAQGRTSLVFGDDPDLDRIIDYLRNNAQPGKPFTFTDARKA